MKQVIIADKAGFCTHLGNLAAGHRETALGARTIKARNRELGIAEGLEIAVRAVEAWEAPPAERGGPPGSGRVELEAGSPPAGA